MKQENKISRNDFFKEYHDTRSVLLDKSDKDKLQWFQFYIESIYGEYLKDVSKDAKILDLGCNKGYLLKTLFDRGYSNLTGVDLSRGDIAIAKTIIPEAILIEDDIYTFLKTTKNKYDLICLKAVVEHVEKERVIELLQLISSCLTSKGFVLIDVYNADWLFCGHERYMDFTHETGFTKESLSQVMNLAFNEVKVESRSSPLRLSGRHKVQYYFFRKIISYILKCAEPEMKDTPFMDRLLIAKGSNKK